VAGRPESRRAHVGHRAHDPTGLGPAGVRTGGEAEVGDPGRAVLGEQDVGGFDVAVQHPGPVGNRERRENLVEHPPHMTRSTGPPATRSARLCPGSRSITMNGAP
jgi:hypothetical protein